MTKIIHPLLVSKTTEQLPIDVRRALSYVSSNSPFYKNLFAQLGMRPSRINTLEQFRRIPTTTKSDLALDYRKFICVPPEKIVDRSCTSGTTSTPIPFVLTENDLQRLTRNEVASLSIAGINNKDVVMLCCTIDQRFMAGLAYFLGLRQIGASAIRQGVSNLLGQWDCILREQPTAIICVPSFLLRMIQFAQEQGIDYRSTTLRKVICIGESIRQQDFSLNALGKRLKDAWPELALHSTYASTEMGAAFTECSAGQGGHHNPKLTFIEVLDPHGNPVKAGETGELVVTMLDVEAMPLIRFRTGDLVQLHPQACTCGRATARIGPIIGRKNQMLKVKGTTVYPPAIHDALNAIPGIDRYVIEVFSNPSGQDDLKIKYVSKTNIDQEKLQRCLREICSARLRFKPAIQKISEAEMQKLQFPNGGRKPRIFIDYRS